MVLAPGLAACADSLRKRDDAANLALLAFEEGRAWEQAGDLERAQACWRRAERASVPLPPGPVRADVQLQMGRLDHLRGLLPSALRRYDDALAHAPPGPQQLELRLRRLLVRLEVGPAESVQREAGSFLHALALDRLPEEIQPLARMVSALVRGTLAVDSSVEERAHHALRQGDADAAGALYHEAFAATAVPERRARFALALGVLALEGRGRADADAWLRRAEELARTHDLPEVLRRALRRALEARGRLAAELDGAEDEARPLLEEAVALAEVQASQFAHSMDAAAYRQQRRGVLRHLLAAACRRGAAADVFHCQELDRGRLLLDLWRAAPIRRPFVQLAGLDDLERQIAACEDELTAAGEAGRQAVLRRREELRLLRDRLLEGYLRDRSRRGTAALPALPTLADLQRRLPPGTLYVAPSIVDDELHLLTVDRGGAAVRCVPGRVMQLLEDIAALRACLAAQLARYRRGLPLGRPERSDLDGCLEALARGPLGAGSFEALAACRARPRRLLWVPEGPLHGLPLHALREGGRYLVEEVEVVVTFSGALLVHQARARRRRSPLRPAVVVTESPAVLPDAEREGEGVAASFLRSRHLRGSEANRAALRRRLASARAVHFACHADFEGGHPLGACLRLPSGESVRAPEWLDEPIDGLPLVTLSACRSGEVAPLLGAEVFGLVNGLLAGGARAVLAGLWPVADREAVPFMWSFYRHRLRQDLAGALASAQREMLRDKDISPLFWGAFALFGDAAGLPAPAWGWRWLARWRHERHARRFPV
jgi:hypothetical protein